jgi:hypothetical protein
MKSSFECFQHAAKCEQAAKDAQNEAGRTVLLETARHWRTLGGKAKVGRYFGEGPRKVTSEVELLAQIEELDSAISHNMDVLSRGESRHASANLWAGIQRKMVKRRELCDRLPGPPLE